MKRVLLTSGPVSRRKTNTSGHIFSDETSSCSGHREGDTLGPPLFLSSIVIVTLRVSGMFVLLLSEGCDPVTSDLQPVDEQLGRRSGGELLLRPVTTHIYKANICLEEGQSRG
ncbi:unnamed protein product [Pleuronectes platessa]|uniref:Uncharacterized protein n=1 Tax=Pleuronectes platessa TaxID=8262 RepID=A0A9N7U423_PLEPL|nr:unnamed protein product [Pleuronectes platessa]